MADNVELPSGSGGATVKTDDDGTAHWQYVKLAHGADNTQTRVTSAAGLPVTPDSGGFTVALSATDNAVLDAIAADGDGIQTLLTTMDAVLDTIKVDTEAIETAVEGTLTVDGSGVTQPVSGTVTANLSATDNGVLDSIDADTSTIASDTTSIDGKLPSTLTGSGNLKVSVEEGSSGGVTHTDDAAFTVGSDDVVPVAGMFDDTATDSVDEGDAGVLRMTADRRLKVDGSDSTQPVSGTVTANAGSGTFTVDGSGVTQPVSGTVTANLSATDNAVLDNIDADLTTVIGHVDGLEGLLTTIDTVLDTIKVDTEAIETAVEGTLTVDGSGVTQPVSGTVAVSSADVVGNVAHGAADSGDPLKTGGKARTSEPTAVDASDRVDAQYDSAGVLISRHCLHEELVDGDANATGTSNTSVIAAQGSGVRTYLTDIIVTNASATDSEVIVKDGTTERLRIPAPANSGAIPVGIKSPLRGTANTAWQFASADSVTTMYVFMSGYTSSV